MKNRFATDTDRQWAELRATMRRELMQEFLLPREDVPEMRTEILPFDTRHITEPMYLGSDLVGWREVSCEASPLVFCCPYRLVIDPAAAPGWEVTDCRIGVAPILLSRDPVLATAYAPLPWWLSPDSESARKGTPQDLRDAMRAIPIENIGRHSMQPGMIARLVLRCLDPQVPDPIPSPRAWFLCHMPDLST